MKSNLTSIFRAQRFLNDIKYPDSYRIAREIVEYSKSHKRISEEVIFNRLHQQEPWEYIKGECEFSDLTFKVNRDTLIPRIETEQLVNDCKEILEDENIKNVIDVGTGSGCILISLVYLLEKRSPYSFFGIDISPGALKVARENEKNILGKKVIKWIKGNLIEKLPNIEGNTLLIANLPYIPTKQYEKLDKSVLDYEPRISLDGGVDGLKYYKEMFVQLSKKNLDIKKIYLETETSIFKDTKKLVLKYYPKAKVTEIKDIYDRKRFLKISL